MKHALSQRKRRSAVFRRKILFLLSRKIPVGGTGVYPLCKKHEVGQSVSPFLPLHFLGKKSRPFTTNINCLWQNMLYRHWIVVNDADARQCFIQALKNWFAHTTSSVERAGQSREELLLFRARQGNAHRGYKAFG